MASSYFLIQDRTTADRKFKNLQHQLWDHFLEYLRSGSPSLLLSQFLETYNLSLPQGSKFGTNSQLSAIPTQVGLKLYVPGKGDFFYREELVDGKRPAFQNSGSAPKFGIVDVVGHHNGKSAVTLSWDKVFDAIEVICLKVLEDIEYFENVDITAPEHANFKLEYAACEIQWLLSCSRFYIASCANFGRYDNLSIKVYQYAMTEISVIGLLLYKGKNGASVEQVQQWINSCPEPFDLVKPNPNDCGGMASFISAFGLQIETRNRGGMRIPGERRTKFVKSGFSGLHIDSSGSAVINGRVCAGKSESTRAIGTSSSSGTLGRSASQHTNFGEEDDDL